MEEWAEETRELLISEEPATYTSHRGKAHPKAHTLNSFLIREEIRYTFWNLKFSWMSLDSEMHRK